MFFDPYDGTCGLCDECAKIDYQVPGCGSEHNDCYFCFLKKGIRDDGR
jgi:hypothetical protein